ncbi:hypothetical protein BC829DRAFT_395045 [Chytridium lagenaria]|nr:hypothetical protein BC829DRAFT_395045 [Chytridium lagenaria]
MDIQLGHSNGIEAVKAIRRMEDEAEEAMRENGRGVGSANAVREAIGAGMDEFLVKPIRRDDVVRVVEGRRVGVVGVPGV